MCFHPQWALHGLGRAKGKLLTWNRWGTKGTKCWTSLDTKGRDHTYKNSALKGSSTLWCSTLCPAYRGEQRQPREPARKIALSQCYISCEWWETGENGHTPPHSLKTSYGHWFQMPGVKMEARERKKAVELALVCRCILWQGGFCW